MFTIRLFFIDLLSWLYKAMGIDYDAFRRIMVVKLRMDERINYREIDNNKNRFASYTGYLFVNLLTGIILALILLYQPLVQAMILNFTLIITVIVAQSLTDFERAFFDTNETLMLKVLPVDSKTLNAAKISHMINYTLFIAISLTIPIMVAGFYRYGSNFVLLMLGSTLLVAIFSVCTALLVYLILFKFINANILKYLITYIQAFIVATLPLLSQIMLQTKVFNLQVSSDFRPIQVFSPQIWFTAPFGIFYRELTNTMFYFPAILGIVFPIIIFVITIMNYGNIENVIFKLNRSQKSNIGGGLFDKLGLLVSKKGIERTSYKFTLDMIRSDRSVIMEILPNILSAMVIGLVLIYGSSRGNEDLNYFLHFVHWFVLANLLTVFSNLSYSENYEASWIFATLGHREKVDVAKGVIKAYMIKYIVIPYIVFSIVISIYFKINLLKISAIHIFFILLLMPLLYASSVIKPFGYDKSNPIDRSLGGLGSLILIYTILGFSAYIIHQHLNFNSANYYYLLGVLLVTTVVLWKYGIHLIIGKKSQLKLN